MDQPTPKTSASDSTLLVTMTEAQFRQVVREEIRAAMTTPQELDRLLTAEKASEVLGVGVDWLYRKAKNLPFTRKLGPKMLRFSQQGIVKWMTTRKVS